VTAPALEVPSPPPAAAEVFGDRLPLLVRYAELLATAGVERGPISPREAPRLWERHLLNCVGVAELVEEGSTLLDLGSGAGLPGLVVACARPDLAVVLAEPLLRRATFLSEAVEALGLRTVVVRRARAEELAGVVQVDAVTARAVAPLDRLGGWALPLLRPGGRLLALKGSSVDEELAGAMTALRKAGAVDATVVDVGREELATAARVAVVTRGDRPAPRAPKAARPAAGPSRSGRPSRRTR
jgi:16S rRNA (guanine527-N7)-methyltransferase